MPMTIISTASEIKSHKDPCLAGAVGVVATAEGVLTGSEDVLAVAAGVAAGVVAAAVGVLTVSEDGLAVTAGLAVAAAGVAGSFRGRAGIGVG